MILTIYWSVSKEYQLIRRIVFTTISCDFMTRQSFTTIFLWRKYFLCFDIEQLWFSFSEVSFLSSVCGRMNLATNLRYRPRFFLIQEASVAKHVPRVSHLPNANQKNTFDEPFLIEFTQWFVLIPIMFVGFPIKPMGRRRLLGKKSVKTKTFFNSGSLFRKTYFLSAVNFKSKDSTIHFDISRT